MWSKFSRRIGPTIRRTLTTASISACVAGIIPASSQGINRYKLYFIMEIYIFTMFTDKTQRMTQNRYYQINTALLWRVGQFMKMMIELIHWMH